MLTDRGSCFTADGFEAACRKLGVEHRKTRPDTPRTNGPRPAPAGRASRRIGRLLRPMVERFNGRVQGEVLGITVASHRDLERLLAGFSSAYNARRQRVLDGRSPEQSVRERLAQDKRLANPSYRPPADPCVLPRALLVVEAAKEVSQPDGRHRSVAFRAFLDRVERAVPPGLEVHLVLDNLKTHTTGPIHDGLVKRPPFHLHVTPTGASPRRPLACVPAATDRSPPAIDGSTWSRASARC